MTVKWLVDLRVNTASADVSTKLGLKDSDSEKFTIGVVGLLTIPVQDRFLTFSEWKVETECIERNDSV